MSKPRPDSLLWIEKSFLGILEGEHTIDDQWHVFWVPTVVGATTDDQTDLLAVRRYIAGMR